MEAYLEALDLWEALEEDYDVSALPDNPTVTQIKITMIDIGCESHGLYHLRTSAPVSLVTDSPSLIHAQLGHPSLAKLQHLVPRLSKLSHLSCESCQLGKHSRSSFSRSVLNRALSPFALVHSNIWEPSRVKSTLGFQYFVTFINDYSRCTWLF
uniref:Retrovirus-related Pol polyprotein from transposon TNT 1-94 n=1 Tax=Cajanus cajan TaxID=3821 RepID=A0A151R418_CAJCA|nr:Retrovirus-related Pol polyprotein from transposon TNT 1-94 [Cajanus cajan]